MHRRVTFCAIAIEKFIGCDEFRRRVAIRINIRKIFKLILI
jgi:hypothetical protein